MYERGRANATKKRCDEFCVRTFLDNLKGTGLGTKESWWKKPDRHELAYFFLANIHGVVEEESLPIYIYLPKYPPNQRQLSEEMKVFAPSPSVVEAINRKVVLQMMKDPAVTKYLSRKPPAPVPKVYPVPEPDEMQIEEDYQQFLMEYNEDYCRCCLPTCSECG